MQQLIRFLRQVLVEQQNRRFVFGFALSSKQISVWLQDRSGVLGTEVPIDFHEVILACSPSNSSTNSTLCHRRPKSLSSC